VALTSRQSHPQPKVEDGFLIALAKQGDPTAYNRIVSRYQGFVRLKASSYFLAGGDSDDLIQEGLIGLYKAVRDFRTDRESSFRNFAELCITRQIITAVKTATRNKHSPLNHYVSFSAPAGGSVDEDAPTLDEQIGCLSTALSQLESSVLSLYLDGRSYEEIGGRLGCDTKTVDNALQRVKRKVGIHLSERAVLV
jgi:RNA polymerase sporulation-specific sigma factor